VGFTYTVVSLPSNDFNVCKNNTSFLLFKIISLITSRAVDPVPGTGTHAIWDDWSWIRSQKLLDGGAEARTVTSNLGFGSAVVVCGACELG